MTDPGPSNDDVWVVIPVFNGERYLGEAIASVCAQSYRPVEVIVVDDGSTDGSADIARSIPGVRVLEQERGGPAVARNAGATAATSTCTSSSSTRCASRSAPTGGARTARSSSAR